MFATFMIRKNESQCMGAALLPKSLDFMEKINLIYNINQKIRSGFSVSHACIMAKIGTGKYYYWKKDHDIEVIIAERDKMKSELFNIKATLREILGT